MLSFAVAMMGLFFFFAKGKKKPFFKLEVEHASLISRSIICCLLGVNPNRNCLLGRVGFQGFSYSYFTYPFVLLFVIRFAGV